MSEWIVFAETVDDFVDGMFSIVNKIVRCEDCVHYHKADKGHPDTDWCKRLICGTIKPDFFCADGERREHEVD